MCGWYDAAEHQLTVIKAANVLTHWFSDTVWHLMNTYNKFMNTLKSPDTWLLPQDLNKANIKETLKLYITGLLWGESTSDH